MIIPADFDPTLKLAQKIAAGEITAIEHAAHLVDKGVIKIGEWLEKSGAVHGAVVLLIWFEFGTDSPSMECDERARYAQLVEFLHLIRASIDEREDSTLH